MDSDDGREGAGGLDVAAAVLGFALAGSGLFGEELVDGLFEAGGGGFVEPVGCECDQRGELELVGGLFLVQRRVLSVVMIYGAVQGKALYLPEEAENKMVGHEIFEGNPIDALDITVPDLVVAEKTGEDSVEILSFLVAGSFLLRIPRTAHVAG